MVIVAVVLLIIFLIVILNSFSKFNATMITANNKLNLIEQNGILSIDFKTRYEYGVCCMQLQRYTRAIEIFEGLFEDSQYLDVFPSHLKIRVRKNIEFCVKPLPWSSGTIEDRNGDFLHYFLVQRFGREHYN